MWDGVVPSSEWIESHVPPSVMTHVHRGGNHSTPGIDYESMHQVCISVLMCVQIQKQCSRAVYIQCFKIRSIFKNENLGHSYNEYNWFVDDTSYSCTVLLKFLRLGR